MEIQTPYEQGKAARVMGRELNVNPHPVGSEANKQWNTGWIDQVYEEEIREGE